MDRERWRVGESARKEDVVGEDWRWQGRAREFGREGGKTAKREGGSDKREGRRE